MPVLEHALLVLAAHVVKGFEFGVELECALQQLGLHLKDGLPHWRVSRDRHRAHWQPVLNFFVTVKGARGKEREKLHLFLFRWRVGGRYCTRGRRAWPSTRRSSCPRPSPPLHSIHNYKSRKSRWVKSV